MDLPPDCKSDVHTADYYLEKLKEILKSDIPFDSICFKDASGTANQRKVFETLRGARKNGASRYAALVSYSRYRK